MTLRDGFADPAHRGRDEAERAGTNCVAMAAAATKERLIVLYLRSGERKDRRSSQRQFAESAGVNDVRVSALSA